MLSRTNPYLHPGGEREQIPTYIPGVGRSGFTLTGVLYDRTKSFTFSVSEKRPTETKKALIINVCSTLAFLQAAWCVISSFIACSPALDSLKNCVTRVNQQQRFFTQHRIVYSQQVTIKITAMATYYTPRFSNYSLLYCGFLKPIRNMLPNSVLHRKSQSVTRQTGIDFLRYGVALKTIVANSPVGNMAIITELFSHFEFFCFKQYR